MDRFVMTMTEFMVRFGDSLGWPREHVEQMAVRELNEGNDFTMVVKNAFYLIPKDSIDNYVKAEAARITGEIAKREAEIKAVLAAEKEVPAPSVDPKPKVDLPKGGKVKEI